MYIIIDFFISIKLFLKETLKKYCLFYIIIFNNNIIYLYIL